MTARRAGEMLREMEKNRGSRAQLKGDVPVGGRAPKPPTDAAPKLSDLGVSKSQSSKWQRLAARPRPAGPAGIETARNPYRART